MWVSASCASATTTPNGAEVSALLEELPSQEQLSEARTVIVDPARRFTGLTEKKSAKIEYAELVVAKAKDIIPKLRKLIAPGVSVLDYPGLLGRVTVRWYTDTGKYEQYLGVYLKPEEGSGPYDLKIIFDSEGIILEIKDVVWKS